ncbi:MAG: hypothetical protein IT449_08630 [Phycisphaerales bacterium]|nr:hypothetical protein [Phycisphaerales bacterium]
MTRLLRGFVWTFALGTVALPARGQTDLAASFRNPPSSARPHTWWHWMNGNITREGITADLEAMKRIGLGGAQIFNVSESIPEGPVGFMSPQWRALVQHAVKEADRLGLELCMHNCAGWSSSGGPWITPQYAMQMIVVSETPATGPGKFSEAIPQPPTRCDYYEDIAVMAMPAVDKDAFRIADIAAKAGFEARYGLRPEVRELPANAVTAKAAIVDLTDRLGSDGSLVWDVPAGNWIILRIGHTPTGKDNHPSPESGRGLECDKLSREAFDVHWAGMMGKVIEDLGPPAGKTLNNCLIDSYEVGHQNWTPRFREEFKKRRGYDLLPWLPVLTGYVVESGEASERFLWDWRRTIADLFADNYYSYFAELCHKNGMLASIEPYDGPFECLLSGRDADIPMGEFWVGGGESSSCKLAASVAHTYGRALVGAESFTAEPRTGRWLNHPYSLKAVGDLMFCAGVNRCIIHRYAHQPWLDIVPGMTMGQWGTHFERTVTWWEQGAAWVSYLTRCQFLLQSGNFVADVCYFAGEEAPNGAPHHPELKAKGYDYDACNVDVLLRRMSVKDGRLILPDGMSYALLVLPDSSFMTPATLAKLHELVEQGATVVGPRPDRSFSLGDMPEGDARVRKWAAEMWGDMDGKSVTEHRFGKGKVVWGREVEDVLREMRIQPDFTISAGGPVKTAWIHRVVNGADVYFVSNQTPRSQDIECEFRVSGRAPELWRADSGTCEDAPVWSERGGRTHVPLHLDPAGSVFVVFRRNAGKSDHFVSLKAPANPENPAPPKIEIVKATYEAVDGAGGADVTGIVVERVRSGDTSILANNATFGDPIYMHVKQLRVEYALNGKSMIAVAEENAVLELVSLPEGNAMPDYLWSSSEGQAPGLIAFRSGEYVLGTSGGKNSTISVSNIAPPVEVRGPWALRFPASKGTPEMIQLNALGSWTENPDFGVRYFSGTAEYTCEFEVSVESLAADRAVYLDLGQVRVMAEVVVNGTNLGVWWKPPFAADITRCARLGRNSLTVRVTNLWVNRLIGDEQLPDDCEWSGMPLARWPQWLIDGQPRPSSQRQTFTTWKHYTKDSPLVESGLLGPVMLRSGVRVEAK